MIYHPACFFTSYTWAYLNWHATDGFLFGHAKWTTKEHEE